MIIIMQQNATAQDKERVCSQIRVMGLKDLLIHGEELDVVAVIGEDRRKDPGVFEQMSGVDRVLRILAPYKLAAYETRKQPTVIRIGTSVNIGGPQIVVIAGPCSVESEQQIHEAAKLVKQAGAHALRGGAFKPRTNPYSFQGLGEEGLKLLAEAGKANNLPIVTEVVTPSEVELVSQYADCLQIGTRNAQNFKLLEACGKQPKPVLYKRGMSMTLDEYLQATEYILAAGNPNVILCERGIRTFEDHTRNTLSLSAIPELKHRSHLPIIVDPSQGTGHARLVPAMSRAAIAAGADGVIVEMHPDPKHAMTDGAQSITPEVLGELMAQLGRIAPAVDRTM